MHTNAVCDLTERNALIYGWYYSELLCFGCQKATRQTLIKTQSSTVHSVLLQGFSFPSESHNLTSSHCSAWDIRQRVNVSGFSGSSEGLMNIKIPNGAQPCRWSYLRLICRFKQTLPGAFHRILECGQIVSGKEKVPPSSLSQHITFRIKNRGPCKWRRH